MIFEHFCIRSNIISLAAVDHNIAGFEQCFNNNIAEVYHILLEYY